MLNLATWTGVSYGYRIGNDLFSEAGEQVGEFFGDEVHGPTGMYLGELRDGRLVVDEAKTGRVPLFFHGFHPKPSRPERDPEVPLERRAMPPRHRDFSA